MRDRYKCNFMIEVSMLHNQTHKDMINVCLYIGLWFGVIKCNINVSLGKFLWEESEPYERYGIVLYWALVLEGNLVNNNSIVIFSFLFIFFNFF